MSHISVDYYFSSCRVTPSNIACFPNFTQLYKSGSILLQINLTQTVFENKTFMRHRKSLNRLSLRPNLRR